MAENSPPDQDGTEITIDDEDLDIFQTVSCRIPVGREQIAPELQDASFVTLIATANGRCISAAGILVQAFSKLDIPYHLKTVRTPPEAQEAFQSACHGTVVGIGVTPPRDLPFRSEITIDADEDIAESPPEPASMETEEDPSVNRNQTEDSEPENREGSLSETDGEPSSEEDHSIVESESDGNAVDDERDTAEQSPPDIEIETGPTEESNSSATSSDESEVGGGEPEGNSADGSTDEKHVDTGDLSEGSSTEDDTDDVDTIEADDGGDTEDEDDIVSVEENDASLFMDGGVEIGLGDSLKEMFQIPTSPPESVIAYHVAEEMGIDADPVLAHIGLILSDISLPNNSLNYPPDTDDVSVDDLRPIYTDLRLSGFERIEGVGIPTTNFLNGMIGSRLLNSKYSGSARGIAKMSQDGDVPPKPQTEDLSAVSTLVQQRVDCREGKLSRFISPIVCPDPHPAFTLEGYADAFDALARHTPGDAVSIACDFEPPISDFSLFKEVGEKTHSALEEASRTTVDSWEIVDVSGVDIESVHFSVVARLVYDFDADLDGVVVLGKQTVAIHTPQTVTGLKEHDEVTPLVDGLSEVYPRSAFDVEEVSEGGDGTAAGKAIISQISSS